MDRIKISFSIVTFNNEDKIEKIIKNIVQIAKKYDFNIFCIDNESTDDTCEIVDKIDCEKVTLIKSKNKGFGYGHNQILKYVDSDYHFVVNPDIILPDIDDNLDKMIAYLEENKQIGLLTPLIKNVDGSIQYLLRNEPTIFDTAIRFIGPNFLKKRQLKFVNFDTGYNKIMPTVNATGCFMVFRTNIFKEVEGFDERYFMYYEDSDITKKVLQVSETVFFPESYVFHEWKRDNKKKLKFIFINISSLIKYMNKWGWKFF